MKVERISGNVERQVLIGMIVDDAVCLRIAAKWEGEMFRSTWANIVGGWSVRYCNRYGKAPKAHLQGLFEAWVEKVTDKETVALIERFLDGLSGEYETLAREINSAYVIDLAAKHFTQIRLKQMVDRAEEDMEQGRLEEAVQGVNGFRPVELGAGESIDVLNSPTVLQQVFDDLARDLVIYPGALGHFFSNQLGRESFVAFLGPEKVGKTFWLMDAGWRAALQRRKVAWFAAGDMTERQMMQRFAIRAAMHPLRSKDWPCEIGYPLAVRRNPQEPARLQVRKEMRRFERPLVWGEAWRAMQEILQYRIRGKIPYLRLLTYPNSSLSVKGIEAHLERWAKEGWVPDVVITDYADILDEESGMPKGYDRRHKIDASWRLQRALSEKYHCLYLTATQSDTDSYTREILGRSNFSESKTKLAHVTGMVGINQIASEKEKELYRLNWVELREGAFSERYTVGVAAALGFSNPAVKSCE
jgi:hypothetical protein